MSPIQGLFGIDGYCVQERRRGPASGKSTVLRARAAGGLVLRSVWP